MMSVVPWCTSDEWNRLSTLVCSIPDEPNNAPKLELTISMLHCLMSRLPSPPIGAQMTSELLQAFLATVNDSDPCKSRQNRPHMAFSIIRFVNYVSHAFQDPAGFGVQPLHKMAAAQNVPDWLVTLRHDASHGALPAAHMLRAAMLAALQWTITAYWQQQETAGETDPMETNAVSLQQLETMLNGPRGRHLNKTLLAACLSSETLREPALRAVADTMVTSYAQLKGGARQTSMLQSWVSTVSAVCRCDLLTELLESLLTSCPTSAERHQQHSAAALWVEQLTLAAQRHHSDQLQPESGTGRSSEAVTSRQLAEAVSQAGPVRWNQLVETALRHKNAATGRILPLLMDGLSPPLPERRRQMLLQLVRIASGAEQPARPPVRVGPEELRRLGIRLPTAAEPANGPTPAPPVGATVAPPTDDCGPSWRRCADGPQWREATEVGRLPWQQKTPVLLDAVDMSGGGLAQRRLVGV